MHILTRLIVLFVYLSIYLIVQVEEAQDYYKRKKAEAASHSSVLKKLEEEVVSIRDRLNAAKFESQGYEVSCE